MRSVRRAPCSPGVRAGSAGCKALSQLALRTIVAILLAAVTLVCLTVGDWAFALLVAVMAGLIFAEWRAMTRDWGLAWFVGGVLYALLPATALLWLRLRTGGEWIVLWAFVVTWGTDIFAYAAGRSFGGPKLAPRFSPNKTWAGLVGGVAGATIAAGLLVTQAGLPRVLLGAAPLFAVAAQAGDLFQSAIKRRAGVKDSGRVLPGHGGVMDRLDGLVPVAVFTLLLSLSGLLGVRHAL